MHLKIAIICVYWGRFPSYHDFTFKTIAHNPGIDMLLFTDQFYESKYLNLQIIPITLNEFKTKASIALGFDAPLTRPYKCCDYKPAYGLIFRDFLHKYNYWAFSDMDMLWGNFGHFLEGWLEQFDIVSTHGGRINGPLSFFKNTETCNRVILEVPDLQAKLKTESYMKIDEMDIDRVLKRRKDLRYSRKEVGARASTYWKDGSLYDAVTGKERMLFHLHRPLLSSKGLVVDVHAESVYKLK